MTQAATLAQLASSGALSADTSGNVGIGTTTPSSYGNGLVVYNSGTGVVRAYGSTVGTYMYASSGGSVGAVGTETNHAFTFNTNNAERMRLDTSGNLLIGKTTTDNATNGISWGGGVGTVVYAGGAGDGPQVQIVNTTAAATVPNGFRWLSFRIGSSATEIGKIEKTSSTTVAYVTSSDYRLKENVIPLTGALQRIANLRPVQWDWKGQADGGEGFIAHELAEFCPQAVTGKKDAMEADGVTPRYQGIDTSFLVATLTAAIQELKAELDVCKAEIAALKGV